MASVESVPISSRSGRSDVLGNCVKRCAHPPAAVADVTEQFGLGEHTVGKGVGVLVKGLWRFPRLELGGEVVVGGQQRVVLQEPWA